jgi:hypothetical protein
MEIEGIQQLVESNIDYNHDVASEYNKMLRWSEQEFANVVQSYHSYYAKLVIKTSRLPWKYLFKIFNLNELELTQQ